MPTGRQSFRKPGRLESGSPRAAQKEREEDEDATDGIIFQELKIIAIITTMPLSSFKIELLMSGGMFVLPSFFPPSHPSFINP